MKKVHKIQLLISVFLAMTSSMTLAEEMKRVKRVSNTLEDVLGIRGSPTSNKRKAPVKITPPLRLKPGETAVQAPGWQHCIKPIKANLNWKTLKSPGYPDFLESQIQCSWIIEAPIGFKVKLAFRDMDMVGTTGTCAKQFVQIIDVGTGKSQGRFCGSTRPGDYVTLGTKARLDLQADKGVTKSRGFLLSFISAKEIPGFRSSKSLPPAFAGEGGGAPGKVNVKSFVSNSKTNNFPKPYQGAKRSSKRLVYESDSRPETVDPAASTTESVPTNTLGTDDDWGWIGQDENIGNADGPARNPSGSPVKVPTGNRPRPRPRPRPSQSSNGPVVVTQSTLPVRITFKKVPTPKNTEEYEDYEMESEGPVIYGADHQPYDPSIYTTEHPFNRRHQILDHRPEVLTTTNLIIIIACCGLFVLMVLAFITFWWFYRKRKIKKRRRAKAEQRQKELEKRRDHQPEMEMKVMNLGEAKQSPDRDRHLPMAHQPGSNDLPPRYQMHSEYPYPREAAMERRGSLRDQYPRDGGMESRGSLHDQYPRDGGMERRGSLHDQYPRDGGIERRGSLHDQYPRDGGIERRGGVHDQYPRDGGMEPRGNPQDQYPRDGGLERRGSVHEQYGNFPARELRPELVPRDPYPKREDDVRHIPRHDVPSHIQLRHEDLRHQEMMQRPPYPEVRRYPEEGIEHRRRTFDMRRHQDVLRQKPPSPLRHQTLDPRRLQMQRDPQFDGRRHLDQPRYPQRQGSGQRYPPRNVRAGLPRVDSRPLPPLPNDVTKINPRHDDVDEDYCSDLDLDSGKRKAPMRREYSPWELEQQKKERKKKLINGEL